MKYPQSYAMLFLVVIVVMSLCPFLGLAQEVPRAEVSAGITSVPFVHTTIAPEDSTVWKEGARLGFFGVGHVPLNDVYGFELDASHTTGRFVQLPGMRVSSTEVFAGPRFSYREIKEGKRVVLYVSTLMGAIYRPYLLSYSGWNWGFSGGVGANIYATPHVGFNVGIAYRRPIRNTPFDQGNLTLGIAFK